MHNILRAIILLLILPGVCLALTPEDNGYEWRAASTEERTVVCKELSGTTQKDYIYWMDMLNAFYNTSNWSIQSLKIKEVVTQIPLSEKSSGQ